MCIIIHSLCLVLCWSTFRDLQLQPEVFMSMMLQARHTYCLKIFFAEPLRLHQVWCVIFRSLQCSTGFKSGLQLGHAETLSEVPNPFLSYLGCVLGVVVLWEDKPLPRQSAQTRSSSRMPLYAAALNLWLWIVSQIPLLKVFPTAWYCHPHALLLKAVNCYHSY